MAIQFGTNNATSILNKISSSNIPISAQATQAGNTINNVLGAVDLTGVGSKITSAITSLPNTADLTAGPLSLLNSNPATKLLELAKKFKLTSVPNLDLQDVLAASAKGIDLTNIEKIPACAFAPLEVAKTFPDLPKADYAGKSAKDIAKMFGVSDPSKIPGMDPKSLKELVAPIVGLAGALIAAKGSLKTDATALKGKFQSAAQQIKSVTSGSKQSVEALQSNLGVNNPKTAASVFGSKSISKSVIDKLVPINIQLPGSK